MKIKALVSFCGVICMSKDEVRECSNEAVLSDLLSAGYVEEAKEDSNSTPKKKRGVKEDESKRDPNH